MKKLKEIKPLLFVMVLAVIISNIAAGQQDSVVPKEIVKLHYFNSNNSMQYLVLESMVKKGKQVEPQKSKPFKAKTIIPPQLKNTWDSAAQHTFLVVAEATAKQEETTTEFTFAKAKITMDTSSADGTKSILVTVMKYVNNAWTPVKDVEMKIGIQRLGGILPAGEQESLTTDSTGTATSEFKKENLPGDEKGDLMLVARVDDNDELGNLIIEKKIPWGVATKIDNSFFDQRALWSTRFRTPLWLLFMAYSIVIGVWGTIIYLVIQLIKIKKLAASAG
jgi:hypothetical protein